MDRRLSRRTFNVGSATLLGGCLLTRPVLGISDDRDMVDHRLVTLGVNALARAPEMNYFTDGHRGAAMISAHLMCVDNKLDDATATRIMELFEANWANTALCETFPEGDPVDDATEQVGKALAENTGVLREVGHDAIFAMHAIKAFRLQPELATAERVRGVCNLVRAMKPWRDVEPDEAIQPPPFTEQEAAARFVLKEASDAIDRFIGFGQGFAGHMLTFGQSIIEMAAMGDVEWAESCRTAFCKYVTVTRKGPQTGDRKINEHRFTELRPEDLEYWQKRGEKTLGLGHVFKYPYAYYDLLTRAKDPELQEEFEAKAWRLF